MCRESKPLDGFYKDKSTRDGLDSRCKECSRKRNKEYYKKNKDQELSRNKEYRDKNRDRLLDVSRQHYADNIDYYRQYYVDNKDAISATNARWRAENRDKISKQQKEYYESNKDNIRKKYLRDKYKITLEQYNKMLEEQDYVCAICKQHNAAGQALSVDHDHKCCPGARSCGDCVRALLCSKCNTGLGQFRDDEDYLQEALNYIKKYKIDLN